MSETNSLNYSNGLAQAAKIEYKIIDNIEQLKNTQQIYKYIKISNRHNAKILPGQIPDGVVGIIFGSNFNHNLNKKNLPKSLTFLYLGYKFTRNLTDLPPNIEELSVGANFNGIIKNPPRNLKKLIIKSKYNRKLPFMQNCMIYMYEDAIGDKVFKGYTILTKKCKEKKPYLNNPNMIVIKMQGYESNTSCCCINWLKNLFS